MLAGLVSGPRGTARGTFGTAAKRMCIGTLPVMAWWYRVVEHEDGTWSCRLGLKVYDTHDELADAIEHCKAIAAADRPSAVFVHPLLADHYSVASF